MKILMAVLGYATLAIVSAAAIVIISVWWHT